MDLTLSEIASKSYGKGRFKSYEARRCGEGALVSALWLDVEVYADREEELQALLAELADEEGDDLPPIIQSEGLGDEWGWEGAA